MNHVLKGFLVAAVAAASVTVAAQTNAPTYERSHRVDTTELDARLERQQVRIDRGIQRGLITQDEARRLRREHRSIERMQTRAKADGRVTRWEAERLTTMLDRADQHIRALRRNLDDQG